MPKNVDTENIVAIKLLVSGLQDTLYSLVLDEITIKIFDKLGISGPS